jgi:tetratricopeptide (TPR) repeat protein
MPLVPGRTLTEIARLMREGAAEWPLPRVLGVLLKASEAVAFAHAQGVIHRDLKPGNVMVGQFGESYVMDWGLARVLAESAAAEPAAVASERAALGTQDPASPLVTRDGEVVGTPAYMPPEQARGDLASIGPHTDVYAAGAMLYHVLAGAPPYGSGSASTASVLAQVLEGPPPPLAGRTPGTPPELVAICERAMARDREDRYADMSGFAADLRAFLEGRVVSAHSAGWYTRWRKLVARNRATSCAVAVALLTLVAGLVFSLVKAQDAEASNALSLAAIDKMLAEVGTVRLEDVPRAWPVRQALVEDAIALYEQILARRPGDTPTRARLARCWSDLGKVRSKLGDLDGAEAALDRAIRGFGALAADGPDAAPFVVARAKAAISLASVHRTRGDAARAEQGLRDVLASSGSVVGPVELPVLEVQTTAHGELGALLMDAKRHREALVEMEAALALARQAQALGDSPLLRETVARRADQLGLTHARMGQHAAAEPCHAEALAILEELHELDPADERMSGSRACALGNLGLCKKRLGNRAEGEALLQRSVAAWRQIVADHPEVPRYHAVLGTALVDLALSVGSPEQALVHLDESLVVVERAIAGSPATEDFRSQLQFGHRQRLMKLCATRRHRDVVAGAAVLSAMAPTDPAQALFAAQFVTHAIGYLADDADLAPERRDALRAEYAEAVVGHLRAARERGCRDVARFEGSHFAAVLEHPGYVALLQELRGADTGEK